MCQLEEELRRQEIPTDLYHLAMIESGFKPDAVSRVGAKGMWQFIPETGAKYGFVHNRRGVLPDALGTVLLVYLAVEMLFADKVTHPYLKHYHSIEWIIGLVAAAGRLTHGDVEPVPDIDIGNRQN